MSALTGTIQRLAFDLTSREPVVDSSTGEELKLWQAGRTLFQCGLFRDNPSEESIVDDMSDFVSATLIVRRTNAQGVALINKTVTDFSVPSYAEWVDEEEEHFVIPLTEVETNQILPHNGVLKVFFIVQVTTNSGSYVAGQGYGEIVNVGLSAGLPTIPPSGPYVFNGDVTVPNMTVTGNLVVNGTIFGNIAASSIQFLDYVDASWHGVDPTGLTDSTTELNAAIDEAIDQGVDLFLPQGVITYSQTLLQTESLTIRGNGGEGPGSAGGTTLKWIGASGGIMYHSENVERGGGLQNLSFDGNNLAKLCILIDGSCLGHYHNLRIFGYTTDAGLKTTGVSHKTAWNDFSNLTFNSATSGTASLWISWGEVADDTTLNTFRRTTIDHTGGERVGLLLGCCDENVFYDTYIQTFEHAADTWAPGVLVDPTENNPDSELVTSRPNGNVFYNLLAGRGGWVQPAEAANLISPNFIYGYGKTNQEPDPVTNGTSHMLIWTDEYGRFFNLNAITTQTGAGATISGNIVGHSDIYCLHQLTSSIKGIGIRGSTFNVDGYSATLALGGTTAAGNVTGTTTPWASTASFSFSSLNQIVFAAVNNSAIFEFWTNANKIVSITSLGLDVVTIIQDDITAPTLLNSWVNYNAASNEPAGFYKSRDGRIWLSGTIKDGNMNPGTTIFTLPVGYRPLKQRIFAVNNSGALGEIQIAETGTVKIYVGGNAYLSLTGISFRPD